VPLEYSIVWVICVVTCGLEAVTVGWPGAPQDRLPAGSPSTQPFRPCELWVPKTCVTWPDAPLIAGARPGSPARAWDDLRLMGLKLVFLIVTRAVSLLGLSRREWWWKDAEILMLRHQLVVASATGLALIRIWRGPDRAWLALLAGTLPAERLAAMRLIVTPGTILRWQRDIVRRRWARWSPRAGRGARRRIAGCGRRCCGWPGRTNRGDTGGSTANSRDSASRWRRPRSGRSSRTLASAPCRAGTAPAGRSSCGLRRRDPGAGPLHRRSPQRHEGLRPGRHRARHPPHPDPRSHRASGPVVGSAAG
jgi:hypothetical protein